MLGQAAAAPALALQGGVPAGAERSVTVVDDQQLHGLGFELRGVKHGGAHGHFAAELRCQRLVGVGERGQLADAGRRGQARLEPGAPAGGVGRDRLRREAAPRDGQQHVQLGPGAQQGLGHEDVAARSQGAIAEADRFRGQHRVDPRRDPGVVVLGETEMSGETQRARRPEPVQPAGVIAGRGQDQAELAQGGGAVGPAVGAVAHGLGQGGLRRGGLAEQQMRFGPGGGEEIRRLGDVLALRHPGQQLDRLAARARRVAGQPPQGGDVDLGVGLRQQTVGRGVGVSRGGEGGQTDLRRRAQRPVLEQAAFHGQRRRVAMAHRVAACREHPPREVEAAGAGGCDDGGQTRAGRHDQSFFPGRLDGSGRYL